ncbi:MAG: signal peptidase [Verrucomicrobiota bacterium]|nr:signal peptidase [Verrucomicrobiota bacterium]
MFRFASFVGYGVLLLFAAVAARAEDTQRSWIRGIYTGSSPRPQPATESVAWQSASALAESTPGGFVLVGSGRSMQPLYEPDTILVLRQLPYSELRRGQTVLYRNRVGKVIAHVLVTKARDGWRTRGLNNPTHDMEPVQAENLVGVVLAAFKPITRGPSVTFAAAR